jgi:hypothetical protein
VDDRTKSLCRRHRPGFSGDVPGFSPKEAQKKLKGTDEGKLPERKKGKK